MNKILKPVKILLDTDIGSDIDDTICLSYLLSKTNCDLLGITTVTGDSIKRAMIASSLCKIAGKDIPIYPGIELPLLLPQKQPIAKQAPALKYFKHDKKFPKGEAIEFMRKTIRANPNEVILLGIGPLTNIAMLFKTDPEIPILLRSLVLMCGAFYYKFPELSLREWNAKLDPHATHIVYNSPVKIHRSIGQDVTCNIILDEKEIKERFQSELLQAVLRYAELWFKEHNWVMFHDPLAATTIFNNNICQFAKGKVEIELLSEKLKGLTFFTSNNKGPHEVAYGVNMELFYKELFSTIR